MVYNMVEALVKHRRTHSAPLVVAIEACSGDSMYVSKFFQEASRHFGMNICILAEIKGGKDQGVPKDEDITKAMVYATEYSMANNTICIADDCVAVSSNVARPPPTMADQRRELTNQFMKFRIDPNTGKMNGKQGSCNDDLLITLMMTLYWSVEFCNSDREDYGEFKHLINLV